MGFISSLKKESREYDLPIWKMPDFILVTMGLANVTVMIVTYIWASGFAEDPREAVLLVAVEAAIIMVIGNVFVESAKHLIEVGKLKKEFIQIISHQMRSPLTTMKWQVELLQKSGEKNFTKKQKESINKIFEENERITAMIADILNMARAEKKSDDFVFIEVAIEKLTKECIDMLKSFAKFKKIQVKLESDKKQHIIFADSEKLKIAIVNLIENAISYSPSNSEILVRIENDGNNVFVVIKDNGIGIEKKEQKLIFRKFYRGAGGRKAQPEGTGLGLFMTKKIIEQMKGSISLKTKHGKGSEFRLSFPIKHTGTT